MTENKKIKNATSVTVDGIKFKSKFESKVYEVLKEKEFEPKYEPWKFTIFRGFIPTVPFYDKNNKTGLLKFNKKKLIDITYTPDFICEYNGITIILEVKGKVNDVFPIKRKLFRYYLETWKIPVMFFEIYSKKQLLQAIEIIKQYDSDRKDKK